MLVHISSLGVMVFDEKYNIVDTIKISPVDFVNESKIIELQEQAIKKHKAKIPNKQQEQEILKKLRENVNEFYEVDIQITKQKIKQQVNEDNVIIQTISNIEEIKRVSNTLVKRLREWYELYGPEISKKITDHEKFVDNVLEKNKEELLREINVEEKESMGAELKKEDFAPIKKLAQQIKNLYQLKEEQTDYLTEIMKKYCPNFQELAGTLIGAKLLNIAGSLKKLSRIPSSTLQLLGAEQALFRHMQSHTKPPKYGVIINHPLVIQADKTKKGKAARMLANKLSIAAKVDYNKGEYIADKLKKQLENKIQGEK